MVQHTSWFLNTYSSDLEEGTINSGSGSFGQQSNLKRTWHTQEVVVNLGLQFPLKSGRWDICAQKLEPQ